MQTKTEPMAYIGRKSCGCVVASCVDDKEHPKYTAEDLAEFVNSGYSVERVTIEQARQMLTGCKCSNPPNAKLSYPDQASELLRKVVFYTDRKSEQNRHVAARG